MTRFLFVHNNYPAQFSALSLRLAAAGHDVRAIGSDRAPGLDDILVERWSLSRGSTPGLFPAATRAEADMIRGYAAALAARRLSEAGFAPDIVIGHPGWGETLFLREIFPAARHVTYAEFFYRARHSDVDFDPEFASHDPDEPFRLHAKSATLALAYAAADVLVSPTQFQADTLPPRLRRDVRIIHEGVRTDLIMPVAERAAFRLPDGREIGADTPLVTFVSRVLEPMRGFHIFMRALPAVLAQAPKAEVLIIGSQTGRGYGLPPATAQGWTPYVMSSLTHDLDLSRVHFLGAVPRETYLAALAASSAHVYLTYPFTLSWSLIEAMAMGCRIVASATGPVLEVLDERCADLVDFFDVSGLSDAIVTACAGGPSDGTKRAEARRQAVERFDQTTVALPAWLSLLDDIGRRENDDAQFFAGH